MTRYGNNTGRSGIEGFDIQTDSITIFFKNGKTYTYSNERAGEENVSQMKDLAIQGEGLQRFINDKVKYDYD